MAHTQHGQLTPVERRTVLALNESKQRALTEIQELDSAISAQIVDIAERQHLPPDNYVIQGGHDGHLYLIRPDAEPAKDAQ